MFLNRRKLAWGLSAVAVAASVTGFLYQSSSTAQAQNDADPGKEARCATRLSIAFLGNSPSQSLLQSSDPQSQVDTLLADPVFVERFARFVNSKMNDDVGASSEEDAAYHLSKYILEQKQPWKNLFVGQFNVVATGQGNNRTVSVQADPNGLGYFRSQAWLLRYAGNELAGLKINTAYRMMHNVLGLKLLATTNAPGADVSATGRQAPACRSCHFDNWWALDKAASVLSTVNMNGNNITFTPADGTPKEVLGGVMVRDDKELITAMVESEQFAFNVCRLSFNYLYGRDENACEAAVFDACIDSVKASGMIQSALSTIAKDQSFCQ